MKEPRTAIVTGAAKRVGRHVAEALIADGWTVVAHVHHDEDAIPDGAIKAVADLADSHCADRIFAAAAGHAPVRLLVNNAARFANDGIGNFKPDEFDAHMAVNVRAPALLSEAFALAHPGGDGLIVNVLDAKLAAPNPDFLSYTLSKQALAGLTDILARGYSKHGIRVNGIAPALMLQSPGQTDANFAAMHARNPLGRGVTPDDILSALRFLIGARTVTGEILTVDAGHRFLALDRDVQFLSGDKQ